MAVIIGGLVPRSTATESSSSSHKLNGAFGLYTLTVDGATYVYAAGLKDNGITAFELNPDGTLTHVQNIGDSSTNPIELFGAANFTSVTLGGETYLYVNASVDDGISAFRVNADGTLTSIQNVTDTSALELNGTEGKMAVTAVGGTTYLLATGDDDNGISVFRVNADGTLTNTYNLTDGGALKLDNAMDVVTATVGGRTYAVVAGEDENGISVFEVNANGTLTNVQNISDDATLNLWGATGLATATVGGATYVICSGGYDDGLSVFAMGADGQLTNVCNVSDSAAIGLNGAQGLTTFVLDTESFVAVSGRDDDALTIFHLGAGGVLTDVTAVFDSAGVSLDESHYNTFASVDGTPMLIASGYIDDGLTVFELGGDGDALVGTSSADLLLGLGGNDTLDGAGGGDRMVGGSGNDTYVVDNVGDTVEEQAGAGTDTVRASVGATLDAQVENLVLLGSSGISGTGNGLSNRIAGNGGANLIRGLGGDDVLEGGGGNDSLEGGDGSDEAVFSGSQGAYAVVQNADGSVTVTHLNGGADGSDRLVGVEWLRFADGVVSASGGSSGGGGGGTNAPPTDITVSGGTVQENSAAGTLVATLGAVDPTPGDSFTFAIADPSGLFEIAGSTIRVAAGAAIDYEAATSHKVTLTVTDSAGGTHQEDLVIRVGNVAPVITGTNSADTLSGTIEDDTIWGRGGNDILSGSGGNDTLYGEGGGDKLDGGEGADSLIGGAGHDTYVIDDAGDTITEAAGQGTDLVQTTLSSFSLDSAANANVENMTFLGVGAFAGTGNALANILTGGNGSDTLEGGGGNDTLRGFAGADILDGGAGQDDFVYAATGNSPAGARDRIIGFAKGADDIVLTSIDANVDAGGDQAFVLDTNGSFSVGEIRQTVSGGDLLLEFNTDNDTSAEMAILLEGVTSPLAASDFEL